MITITSLHILLVERFLPLPQLAKVLRQSYDDACKPANYLFVTLPFKGQLRKVKWAIQYLCIRCCSLSGGYLKCRLGLRALTKESRDELSLLFSVYVQACFGERVPVCVCLCASVCVIGQDQLNKSTLERIAQSSFPTHLSLSISLSQPP